MSNRADQTRGPILKVGVVPIRLLDPLGRGKFGSPAAIPMVFGAPAEAWDDKNVGFGNSHGACISAGEAEENKGGEYSPLTRRRRRDRAAARNLPDEYASGHAAFVPGAKSVANYPFGTRDPSTCPLIKVRAGLRYIGTRPATRYCDVTDSAACRPA